MTTTRRTGEKTLPRPRTGETPLWVLTVRFLVTEASFPLRGLVLLDLQQHRSQCLASRQNLGAQCRKVSLGKHNHFNA